MSRCSSKFEYHISYSDIQLVKDVFAKCCDQFRNDCDCKERCFALQDLIISILTRNLGKSFKEVRG